MATGSMGIKPSVACNGECPTGEATKSDDDFGFLGWLRGERGHCSMAGGMLHTPNYDFNDML